jgi:hypothetical protein
MMDAILAWDATATKYILGRTGWWKIDAMTRVSEDWLVVALVDSEGDHFTVDMRVEDVQRTVDTFETRKRS